MKRGLKIKMWLCGTFQCVKKHWKKYLYAAWLGGSITAFTNVKISDWQYYVIVLPIIMCVAAFNEEKFIIEVRYR